MRIVKNLLEHKLALLLVIILLCGQAFCDLSLPRYTSKIVDTGIQQGGIEDAATSQMSERTYNLVGMMLSEEDEELLNASYEQQSDGTYALTDAGYDNREELNAAVAFPMVAIHYSASADTESTFDLDAAYAAYQAGILTKDQIVSMEAQAKEQLASMGDSIMEQQAVVAARAEYEALGVDMHKMQMHYLWSIGAMMLGLAAFGALLSILVGLISSVTGARIGRDLRSRLFKQVVSFSDAEIGSFSAASLITRGTNDITLIQTVSIMMQRMVLYAPILAIGGIIMVSKTNASMGWIIALAIVIVLVVIIILFGITGPKFKIMQKLIDRVNLVSREVLTGLPVIRAFGREAHEEGRFDDANTTLMRTQLFTNRAMTFMMPVLMIIMNLVSVLIVWVGGHHIDNGTIQTGDMIAFLTYAMVIVMGFLMIGMISIMLPRANVAANRIHEVITCKPTIVDPAEPRDSELPSDEGARIVFDDVTFRYSADSDPVLEHVSFVAEPGKTCALIGATGSGKSTAVKLIERFYDVDEGSVTIDGIDVRQLTQHGLRAQIGYVPQQAFLFSGTVQSNVGYGEGADTPERIDLAVDVAQAREFVDARPEGLDTEISQGGTNVSGGQRQRLAIARALAVPARAYVFDDSFSALDYKTDAALREELSTKLAGKTVVIVAQRIATVMHADNIVVLDEGRVVGQGTHRQLLETCPEYHEIALSQLSEEELMKGGDAR